MRCSGPQPIFHEKKKKEKKTIKRAEGDERIATNQGGQLNIQVNANILGENSVKGAMRRYLLSFEKAKTLFSQQLFEFQK